MRAAGFGPAHASDSVSGPGLSRQRSGPCGPPGRQAQLAGSEPWRFLSPGTESGPVNSFAKDSRAKSGARTFAAAQDVQKIEMFVLLSLVRQRRNVVACYVVPLTDLV